MRAFVRFVVVTACAVAFVGGCRNTIVGEGEGEGEGEDVAGEGEGEGEGDNCPDEERSAIELRVHDQDTNIVLCDADARLDDGATDEALVVTGPAPNCIYQGAFDRPGLYVLTIARTGYATLINRDIEVRADDCGDPITREFDLGLDPL